MRIVWVSPNGKGWALAHKLRELGNKVVYYNPSGNTNGLGYLPTVTEATWLDYAKRSELVVVDDVPDSRRTRRSWAPSDLGLDVQVLRHAGVSVIGPTPTTELFTNDPRYQRKLLRRHGLTDGVHRPERVQVTISRDPSGQTFLVWRHRHLLGDGVGPDVGNLGDIVLPIHREEPLVACTLEHLEEFVQSVGHHGYLNLTLSIEEPRVYVEAVNTGFLYPAIFVQFANLLVRGAGERTVCPGAAITVLDLETDQHNRRRIEDVLQYAGVFGGELHREPQKGGPVLHGQFAFAVCGLGHDWPTVESDVNRKLAHLVHDYPGLGFRPNIGHTVIHHMSLLRSWGYLNR